MTLEEHAAAAGGNWQHFESFGWHDQPKDAHNWTLISPAHRDSGLLEQSNSATIAKCLESFEDDVQLGQARHWAVGRIDNFAVRVYDAEGNITAAFKELHQLAERLEDYAILDDEDYSQREYDAALEAIVDVSPTLDGPPEGWEKQVFSWLWDNDQQQLESVDDHGACPSKEAVETALRELKLLPIDWAAEVYAWIETNRPLDPKSFAGAAGDPSVETVIEALLGLGWTEPEEE